MGDRDFYGQRPVGRAGSRRRASSSARIVALALFFGAGCQALAGFDEFGSSSAHGGSGESNGLGGKGGAASSQAGRTAQNGSSSALGGAAGSGNASGRVGAGGTSASAGAGAAGSSGAASSQGGNLTTASGGANTLGGNSNAGGKSSGGGAAHAGEGGAAGAAGAGSGMPCSGALHGAVLVPLPSGNVDIGTNDLDTTTQPVHRVSVAAFCIDRTEVTLADYTACVNAGACTAPDTSGKTACNFGVSGREQHPINCVDVARAQAFCAWAGKRLPSEEEWEYAARGSTDRDYPWGNQLPDDTLANWSGVQQRTETMPVGSFPLGATPEGVLDLAGNVWEYTATLFCDSYLSTATCSDSLHVGRGGSWASAGTIYLRSAYRDEDGSSDARYGFRCAF